MQAIQKQKARLRQRLQATRASIGRATKAALDKRLHKRLIDLPQLRAAKSVFCFVSMPDEVHTHGLIQSLLKEGKTVAVPKLTPEKTMLAVECHRWSQLQAGDLGILSPQTSHPYPHPIDVCITPGLGFTERGARLGFGRAYYDRWFSQHPHICKIALAYECQILDELPQTASDVPVDLIITEQRLIKAGNGA